MPEQRKPKASPTPNDAAIDRVEEASEESFPASDAPSWAATTGEKSGDAKQDAPAIDPKLKGCAPSFIMQERGEIGELCAEPSPDPQEEFVQPDKEKEAGGEG